MFTKSWLSTSWYQYLIKGAVALQKLIYHLWVGLKESIMQPPNIRDTKRMSCLSLSERETDFAGASIFILSSFGPSRTSGSLLHLVFSNGLVAHVRPSHLEDTWVIKSERGHSSSSLSFLPGYSAGKWDNGPIDFPPLKWNGPAVFPGGSFKSAASNCRSKRYWYFKSPRPRSQPSNWSGKMHKHTEITVQM